MPRDNKIPLIKKIARQAYKTFKGYNASIGDNKVFLENHGELVALVTPIRAVDLKIPPRKTKPGSEPDLASAPVTYMHICETDAFSMGVFLLRSGASIPLHDHPGMNGMLKVLYGKVNICCFDNLEFTPPAENDFPSFDPPLTAFQKDLLRRAVLCTNCDYSETSAPCLLTPQRENLHQIAAVDGPAAFLDILAPPYDPDDGRDCHYYKVLQRSGTGGTEGTPIEQNHQGEEKQKDETWLIEIPQPEDFWCVGEPYPGPVVSI